METCYIHMDMCNYWILTHPSLKHSFHCIRQERERIRSWVNKEIHKPPAPRIGPQPTALSPSSSAPQGEQKKSPILVRKLVKQKISEPALVSPHRATNQTPPTPLQIPLQPEKIGHGAAAPVASSNGELFECMYNVRMCMFNISWDLPLSAYPYFFSPTPFHSHFPTITGLPFSPSTHTFIHTTPTFPLLPPTPPHPLLAPLHCMIPRAYIKLPYMARGHAAVIVRNTDSEILKIVQHSVNKLHVVKTWFYGDQLPSLASVGSVKGPEGISDHRDKWKQESIWVSVDDKQLTDWNGLPSLMTWMGLLFCRTRLGDETWKTFALS